MMSFGAVLQEPSCEEVEVNFIKTFYSMGNGIGKEGTIIQKETPNSKP
jgi:hypothetical protein